MTEDQKTIYDAAIRFFQANHSPAQACRLALAPGPTRARAWQPLVEQGWPQMLVAEAAGGLGLGLQEAWPVAQAAGCHLLSLPLAATMAVQPLLPAQEPGFAWADADGLVEGADGGAAVVACQGAGLWWHEAIAAGPGLDPSMPVGWLPAEPAGGRRLRALSPPESEALHCRLRLLRVAEMLGAAQAALHLAAAYAGDRQQFGRPIGANQAVKHRLAECWMALDDAGLALQAAAGAHDAGEPGQGLDNAQWLAVEAATRSVHQTVQTHGAMGITWECDVHLYLKRVLRLAALLQGAASQDALLERVWLAAG